jgi:Transmembrane domain of unknown function (DUF3566)
MVVRRIGPGSAFKVGLVLYAGIGLIGGLFIAGISGTIGSLGSIIPGVPPGTRFGFGMGVAAIVVLPIFYGIVGGVIAWLMALIYNAVAKMVGGLEVDIS